jgi:hypothetical protein
MKRHSRTWIDKKPEDIFKLKGIFESSKLYIQVHKANENFVPIFSWRGGFIHGKDWQNTLIQSYVCPSCEGDRLFKPALYLSGRNCACPAGTAWSNFHSAAPAAAAFSKRSGVAETAESKTQAHKQHNRMTAGWSATSTKLKLWSKLSAQCYQDSENYQRRPWLWDV